MVNINPDGVGKILQVVAGAEKAVELLSEGLFVSGARHKQWYMEQALMALGIDMQAFYVEMEERGWACICEKGVAP